MTKNACVVIPVYKSTLDKTELISLNQCLKVLSKYDIFLVCPNDLRTETYKEFFEKAGLIFNKETFSPTFFTSVSAYNLLMLNKEFYSRFTTYEYMLIYQLDGFVFEDTLQSWCNQGYDFIGAPIIDDGFIENRKSEYLIGNGGFSLRKIESFIRVLSANKILFSCKGIRRLYTESSWWQKTGLSVFGIFGYKNTLNYFKATNLFHEDCLFACMKYGNRCKLRIPDFNTSIAFSFEKEPSKLFALNNRTLPFGCHAWEIYEYDSFWHSHIPNSAITQDI